ncbi:hypothetical protein FNF27_04860 [Cafeteria roenbergensis]|uniref:J domain-containing protein n=1 Tax=Cafeteria roenbergensis TaxID=33653 RepID=A0A5A8CBK2_CAFRO|nr:hypothetical protein FNF29_05317 [Cafeteria roenbergensis]KAA0166931.1 hypothetical protein FNF28_03003 [Cafeteria roenbergensis]KAA0173710.1 hypothetical protein FNF27_04860 [Cafeteria roenbergensis]|eukprot:KAA0150305.1 hypothetical protein FNF29_05317 [Cafeteria roenbergensis]
MAAAADAPSASSGQSLYDRLGVDPKATGEQLRVAYRALALELHPDKAGDHARARFDAVQEAWERLRDEESRRKYDAELLHERSTALRASTQLAAEDCDIDEAEDGSVTLVAPCRCGACFRVPLVDVESAGARGLIVTCTDCSLRAHISDSE